MSGTGRKILIVAYYWPPSGGPGVQRWLKFVKYLKVAGFDPHVLTVENPTYAIIDQSLEADIPAGTPVFKAPAWEPYALYARLVGKKTEDVSKLTMALNKRGPSKEGLGNWIRANLFIPDARVGWIRSVTAKAIQLHNEHQYDGFITTGPPHSTHVAGLRIKKKTGLYWLADMRDPWVNIHYNQLIPRSKLAIWLDTRLEQSVLTTADDVVVVTPGMKRDFEKTYPNRYHVIPNGFDEEDLPMNKPAGEQKKSLFLMRYVGSLPESSVPFGFFDALKSLPATLDWQLEFIGNVHQDVHRIVTEYALDKKVFFLPYRPHAEALQMMQEATVLCLFLPKTKGSGNIYSGKLFEYAGLRKPVFYVGEATGDGAEFLRNAGLGLIYEHTDTTGMRKALENLITGSAALPQPNERQNAFIGGFSRRALTDKLIKILSERLGN